MNLSSKRVTIRKPIATKPPEKEITRVEETTKPLDIVETVDEAIRQQILDHPLSTDEKTMLEHLGEYIEEPYTLIESYFRGQHLERLVRHQIESYNHFINYQIQRTIEMFNPVLIRSENDYVADRGQYFLEAYVSFENFKLYPPQIHENNGATKIMLPQEAKLRNFTYASTMTVDVQIKYVIRNTDAMDTPKIITKTLPKINIGKMPIMLKSSICVLTQNKHIHSQFTGECPMDCGGYFVIKGSEKTVLGQERAAENRVYCFDGRNSAKWNWIAEIKSIPDFKCISPKQIEMMIASKNNGFGHGIYVNIPRIKQPIELFVVFRALGVLSDREICDMILLNIEDAGNSELLNALQGSIVEANKYLTQEDAIRQITAYVAYTPINMDRETGQLKKREFAIEVLNSDLFPHCHTPTQKIYMLGYMAKKLIQTSLGWLPCDDRDSYLNKRIDLTGTLLNNLFRNYFNKLVKEMQKQVVREINGGSWRSTEDYENIINMTNIYKIMKSTTIENGITRALSTGDFSIKQANSSKVGVAQVLNRLTYVASLSHLRRVNTPLEKSGELIAPRKLHNTTWGFLCPAETPEGQSIGVVKNISYMSHITIPTKSSSLYEYVEPHILKVEDTTPQLLAGKIKVFVNGTWVGVTEKPFELYEAMKDKKYRGIINIYTAIVFDYKLMEIRICNDGGRLTRPLLRVRNNKAIITPDIIEKVDKHELAWNDLLTSCRIDESVVEYIDPEEQNHSMVAMKTKHGYLGENATYNYTHCEIHPSTIFGVLASCIPFPEHNQAPRNTYQCLGTNELVWMADGTKKKICDVNIGESVLTFHPETMEVTSTHVINHFVRKIEYPIYCLKTISGREITATEDHKFMTNQGWATVKELTENPELTIGISMQQCNTIENVDIVDNELILDEQMFIAKMRSIGIDETDNRKISKIFQYTEELKQNGLLPLYKNNKKLPLLSRIIGFLYADGSINVYNKNSHNYTYKYKNLQCSFDFGTQNDATLFEFDINSCGFKTVKILEGTRSFTHSDDDRIQTHHTFTCIHNGCLPAFLISLGLSYGKKTETIRNPIPNWIMSVKEYAKQFMRGFQGGDGCKIRCDKTTDKRYTNPCDLYIFHTGETSQQISPSYEDSMVCFMNQCCNILEMFDIHITSTVKTQKISNTRTKVSFTISSSKDNLIKYYDNIGYAYAETKNYCSFKNIEYLKSKNEHSKSSNEKYINIEKWSENVSVKNGYCFIPLLSITPEPDGLISDITVESENHSFIASSGFASSNCAMAKQAIGVYALNYDQRMDKTAYVLSYPSRPLVDTRLMNFIHLNQIPSGCQIHVAIMTHTGYNQEDSVLVNKGSIDRGLFSATIYHTEKDEDKNIIRDEIIRCKPDKTKTKGIKFGNYDKVNNQGFIPENTLVENRDVIIAKIIPIKENRNDPTKTIKYEDQSKTFRTTEETYIDKNYTGRNGDGYNFAKVRVRVHRKPGYGDKFSSRHGQKGTCGNIIPECDMPFTKEGLRPDIIINPHAIPSRMTIAQLKETLLGKVLLELGMFGDGTSFGNLDIKTIIGELQNLGYESHGNEVMYNGLTGEQLETSIFIGPVFYQRLKHMVADKQHSRAIGPMVNLTRQPAEGRSRDGGFRIGEMERDVMIAHGMSKFCRERLYDVSDKYSTYVCRKCGMIASYNDGNHKGSDFSVHLCNTCNNTTDFAKVEIPYAYKLMAQELQTINVVPRLITE
jgi:DNA-directed RNA polymerase beta subunit